MYNKAYKDMLSQLLKCKTTKQPNSPTNKGSYEEYTEYAKNTLNKTKTQLCQENTVLNAYIIILGF